jgi:predicted ribonuclease toxin of YeeF-YezG toxin-antitoxin module
MIFLFCLSVAGVYASGEVVTNQANAAASQARVKKAAEKATEMINKIKQAMSTLQKDASNQTALATVQAAIAGTSNISTQSVPQTTRQPAAPATK